jgi:hypothetical protein
MRGLIVYILLLACAAVADGAQSQSHSVSGESVVCFLVGMASGDRRPLVGATRSHCRHFAAAV